MKMRFWLMLALLAMLWIGAAHLLARDFVGGWVMLIAVMLGSSSLRGTDSAEWNAFLMIVFMLASAVHSCRLFKWMAHAPASTFSGKDMLVLLIALLRIAAPFVEAITAGMFCNLCVDKVTARETQSMLAQIQQHRLEQASSLQRLSEAFDQYGQYGTTGQTGFEAGLQPIKPFQGRGHRMVEDDVV